MRKLLACLFTVLVSACATTSEPVMLYSGPPKPIDQVAILTSDLTEEARNLVRSDFGTDKGLRAATIHAVDEHQGKISYGAYRNHFNSAWDWSYNIQITEGPHKLIVSSNVGGAINPSRMPLTFNAVKGHKYFVGQMSETMGSAYRWTPLLIDLTENRRLYPPTINWRSNQ